MTLNMTWSLLIGSHYVFVQHYKFRARPASSQSSPRLSAGRRTAAALSVAFTQHIQQRFDLCPSQFVKDVSTTLIAKFEIITTSS